MVGGPYRKKGTGSIRRRTGLVGYEVWSPQRNHKPAEYLGVVYFYRDGDKLIDEWKKNNPEETHGQA